MNIQDLWQKALKSTRIIRPRVKPLCTNKGTEVPYIFLAESKINSGDTIVRKGSITVEKPQIVLPYQLPIFEDFDFEKDMGVSGDSVVNFFLVRGVSFPNLKYKSNFSNLEVFEGSLKIAQEKFNDELLHREDVETGLVLGDEESWQFSILLMVADAISRGTASDIRKIIDDLMKDK